MKGKDMTRFSAGLMTAGSMAALLFLTAPTANAVSVDYTTVADGEYASISLGGTTVTGSSLVTSAYYAGWRGLGIKGGGSNLSLDIGETLSIDFGALALVSDLELTVVDIDPPGNVTFSFEAFRGSSSLGSFSIPFASSAPQTYDLFALSGGQYMSSIDISVSAPSAPLGLQIQGVSYTPVSSVPDGGSTLGMLVMVFGLFGRSAFRRWAQA
jgi:hypothetical protein